MICETKNHPHKSYTMLTFTYTQHDAGNILFIFIGFDIRIYDKDQSFFLARLTHKNEFYMSEIRPLFFLM